MDWTITPTSSVSGEVTPPADKSITHRAIMLSALADGESVIENYLGADDCMRTLEAFHRMGIGVERTARELKIHGRGLRRLVAPASPIDAGNSGTMVRLMAGIVAGQDVRVTFTGDESLSRRPMKRIIEPLSKMGAVIEARDGDLLPLVIQGSRNLKPLSYKSPVASAQVKSCVLLAGIQAKGTTTVTEPERSRDHTERMLAAFGAHVSVKDLSVSVKGPAHLKAQRIRVPGDISSAAFFMVAAAIVPQSRLMLRGVGINPTRDGVLEVLKKMGASITVDNREMISGEPVADIITRTSELYSVKIEPDTVPRLIDEIPIIVLAATQCQGKTVITGAQELRVKESDRIKTITDELRKLGASIEERPDGLVVSGPTELTGADVDSHGDHRIAMMLAVAGLIAKGKTVVHNIECIETSFPGFLTMLRQTANG